MQHVALLRGIGPVNPAMRNENLRRVVEELGFGDVRTVVTSGNVVFEAGRRRPGPIEAQLEAAWPAQLGFTSTTIVRTRSQIESVMLRNPFDGLTGWPPTSQQVTFLKHEPEPRLELPYRSERGDFQILEVRDRTIYSVVDERGRPPEVFRLLERTFGTAMTTRSWTTVRRIATTMALR